MNKIVETAREYLGFTARGNNSNTFAIEAGLTGEYFPWDGAFVDRVLKEAGVSQFPANGNTAAALSFYLRNGLQRRVPKPGDLVFYGFQTSSHTASFDAPHVGIVSDTARWKKESSFRAIEAQVNSGQPKAPTEENGVYERTRYATDVLAFIRISNRNERADFLSLKRRAKEKENLVTVRPAQLTRCLTQQQAASAKPEIRRAVEAVQIALATHPAVKLRNATRGVYDSKTRSAAAAFQRFTGKRPEECTGMLSTEDLQLLADNGKESFFHASE